MLLLADYRLLLGHYFVTVLNFHIDKMSVTEAPFLYFLVTAIGVDLK